MGRQKPGRKKSPETKQSRWGFRGMTVRDWLQLLIVPLVLVVIGFLFTMQQDARQRQIEDQRAESERKIEEQRAQDAALQAYLDQMSQLMLEGDLRSSQEDSEVRTLARARTRTVLARLDGRRKGSVVQFLYEASLIDKESPVVSLFDVRLRGADLSQLELSDANLSGADLRSANLSGADLSDASGVTDEQLEEQLEQAKSLEGATMPNGQKYEDWLLGKMPSQQLSHACAIFINAR